jgi:hypothetical protein
MAAQVVRGTLVDETAGTPISGALVALIDAKGTTLVRTLTDESGRFGLRATTAGPYRLRADRIGFRSTTANIELAAGQTLSYRLAASAAPVSLSAIRVTDEKSCAVRKQGGQQSAAVWEEARKALDATTLTQDQRLFSVTLSQYERVLDAYSGNVMSEVRRERSGHSENPFTSISAAKLALGYVQDEPTGTVYYAPDARVLLSDEFLDGHCFWVRRGTGENSGQLGLAFEPVKGQKLPDIAGTVWLDEKTSELRYVEYGYRKLKRNVASDRIGGRVDFKRMPNGAWIVQQWAIRMPQLTMETKPSSDALGAPRTEAREKLVAIHETGGEVVSAVMANGAEAVTASFAGLSGVVYDSTTSAPLAGAKVFLSGTQYSATTDSSGSFAIDRIPAGSYAVGFSHPRLDSLGVPAPSRDVRLTKGQSERLSLAVPSLSTVLSTWCAADPAGAPIGLIHGVVRDAKADTAIAGAIVRVSWRSYRQQTNRSIGIDASRLETSTNARGVYRACGVPADASPLTVEAQIEGQKSAPSEARLPAPGVLVRNLRINTNETVTLATSRASMRGELPVRVLAASDTALADTLRRSGVTLVGRITDPNGNAIAGAQLRVAGATPWTGADAAGFFRLAAPPGTDTVEVRALGYRSDRWQVRVPEGRAQRVSLTMELVATSLPTSRVAGRTSKGVDPLQGFDDRRKRGNGAFITREEIDKRGSVKTSDLLRAVPGVRVVPMNSGVAGGNEYAIVLERTGVTLRPKGLDATGRSISNVGPRDRSGNPERPSNLPQPTGLSKMATPDDTTSGMGPTQICPVGYFLDGHRDDSLREGIDLILRPQDIEAIEVYKAAQVPPQYMGPTSRCGVIVIWTRNAAGRASP